MTNQGTTTHATKPTGHTIPANQPIGVDGFRIPRRARWIEDDDTGCWAHYLDDAGYVWSIAIEPGHRSSHYGTRKHRQRVLEQRARQRARTEAVVAKVAATR